MTERELIGLNYYFQALRKINIDIIKLAGIDYLTKDNKLSETFCTVIRKITGEIIPCRINNGSLFLDKKSGILMLNIDFLDLEDELKIILEKHEDVLVHLRKIRNKLEHEPHYIYEYISANGSDLLLKTVLKYEEAKKESEKFLLFDLGKIIDLIIDINVLYEKIINKVLDDLSSNAYDGFIIKDLKQKFSRICFDEYNKIYDSGLLIEVGRCIYDV